jgi:hypothetical protein
MDQYAKDKIIHYLFQIHKKTKQYDEYLEKIILILYDKKRSINIDANP